MKPLKLDVGIVQFHFDRIVNKRRDEDGTEGGMPSGVTVEWGDTDQPVYTAFRFEETVCIVSADLNRRTFNSGHIPILILHNCGFIALFISPSMDHAEKHGTPILALCPPCPGLESYNGIPVVVRIAQHILKLESLQAGDKFRSFSLDLFRYIFSFLFKLYIDDDTITKFIKIIPFTHELYIKIEILSHHLHGLTRLP